MFDNSADNLIDWGKFGRTSMVIQWISLCSIFTLCQLRTCLNKLPPIINGCLAYSVCLIFSGAILWASQYFFNSFFSLQDWLKSLIIAAIISGILLRYIYVQEQLKIQKQAELNAKLTALQARIQPHFLFNSMNTIASLISSNPTLAEKAVEDLSDLFRASLRLPGLIALSDELSLCRSYLDIEAMRLGKRMAVKWEQAEKLPDAEIPSLTLQPILENAILHGIQPLIEGGEITITICDHVDSVYIVITNPVAPANTSKATSKGNQIAQQNIANRLDIHFGSAAFIDITKSKSNYTVKLSIPKKKVPC